MKIEMKRLGEIGMHIMQTTQTPEQKWISFFVSPEEIETVMKDEQGFIDRLPHNHQDVVRKRLAMALDQIGKPVVVEDAQRRVPHNQLGQRNQSQDTSAPITHFAAPHAIMETDKGSFYHMITWYLKLKMVFKHIDGFETIFAMACLEAKVDPTIDYISETKKKAIGSNLQQCSNDYIQKLAESI